MEVFVLYNCRGRGLPPPFGYTGCTVYDGPSSRRDPHRHQNPQLSWVLEGELGFFSEHGVLTVRAGEVVMLGPGVSHCCRHLCPGRAKIFNIYCGDLRGCTFESLRRLASPELRRRIVAAPLPAALAREPLEKLVAMGEGHCSRIAEYALNLELLALCVEAVNGQLPEWSAPALGGPLAKVLEFVEAHLADDLALADLAAAACLSPSRFSGVFTAALGTSPMRYVLQRRIARAETLLGDPEVPIETVAAACGFNSVAYFGRMFRRLAGIPPGRYRRQRGVL